MKIEAGKSYKTRDGRKVGPMERYDGERLFPWHGGAISFSYQDDGRCCADNECPTHLISEWTEPGPVRTVTRKEIVPGKYGKVLVGAHQTPGWIDIRWPVPGTTAPELRAAAAVLTEIADALEQP